MLEEHPHPNPQKAREGKKKHRLVPDPVRAPIVLMIFEDYCVRGLWLGEICDKLNGNLDRDPPPKRNRKDEMPLRQTWSRSQIWAMLRNPKYTGYNVWGRHDKRRGRPTYWPREQWVWSPTPGPRAGRRQGAMLDAVPDLRPALASCDEAELADLLTNFDVTASYDKTNRHFKLGATLTPELVAAQEAKRPPGGRPRSRISSIAGAGFEPATFGL